MRNLPLQESLRFNHQKPRLLNSFKAFARDIKLSHSIFALPFAASAFFLARLPVPTVAQFIAFVVCMVSARSFAMGVNRYLDRDIDAHNPRTVGRALPSGYLLPGQVLMWSLVAAFIFILASCFFGALVGWLAFPVLLLLAFYSRLKHMTWMTHWYLGACLGLAPMALQLALAGMITLPMFFLACGVMFWTAGFDLLYSLQDIGFDRSASLYSFPARFGPWWSIWASRCCFVAMIGFLMVAGFSAAMGYLYFSGIGAIGLILVFEQYLVRDAIVTGQSKNINAAFFTANAYVSVLFFSACLLDFLVHKVIY